MRNEPTGRNHTWRSLTDRAELSGPRNPLLAALVDIFSCRALERRRSINASRIKNVVFGRAENLSYRARENRCGLKAVQLLPIHSSVKIAFTRSSNIYFEKRRGILQNQCVTSNEDYTRSQDLTTEPMSQPMLLTESCHGFFHFAVHNP
jgi:hypothetical protein